MLHVARAGADLDLHLIGVGLDRIQLVEHGFDQIHRAAAKAVKDAVPFPAPPWDASEDELSFTLPIEFKLQ